MAIKNVFLTTERKIAVVVYRFLPIGVETNQLLHNKKTGIKRNFSKLKRERVGSLNVLINFLNPTSKQDITNTSKFNIQVVLNLGTKLFPKTKVYYYS